MLPQVLFVGPTKTGTTWIDDYLRARGDVALPTQTKETYFFDKRHKQGLAWYEAQFPREAGATRLCVEVAPSLFHKPEAAARVARDLPGVKVVCSIREPVSRAASHYFHYLKAGEPNLGFAEMARRHTDIIEASLYHKHVLTWRAALGPDRVKMIYYDEIVGDAEGFVRRLCSLLDLPHVAPPASLRENASNVASVPTFAAAARLARHGADWLRRIGAHAVVNALKSPALLRTVYGRPVDRARKKEIEREAEGARGLFADDYQRFCELAGRGADA